MRAWFLAIILSFVASGVARAAEPLIGYVDLQKAIVTVEEGKRAKEALRKTYEEKQKALSDKEEELTNLKAQIERELQIQTPEAQQRRAQFQSKLMALQQSFMKEQQELQQLEAKQLQAITEKMRTIIADIGREGGYSMILEIQGNRLLFAKDHLNLTNEVIRKYNAKFK